MNNVATKIYERYGFWAIVAVAFIVIGLWIAAHYTAAPGGTVSVLWGLVEYTKEERKLTEGANVPQANISSTRAGDSVPEQSGPQPSEAPETKDEGEKLEPAASQPLAKHEIVPVAAADKTYLRLTPRQLLDSVKGMTDLQANLFVEQTYEGKWIRIHGPVDAVLGIPGHATLVFRIEGVTTRVELAEGQFDKATHLREGDVVTVDGRFEKMDNVGPDFDNGTIVEEG